MLFNYNKKPKKYLISQVNRVVLSQIRSYVEPFQHVAQIN